MDQSDLLRHISLISDYELQLILLLLAVLAKPASATNPLKQQPRDADGSW